MENKMTIKNSDTKLFRVSIIEGVSNCFYIRVKNSDLDKFDFETCLRNVFYTTNQQQLLMKYSDEIEIGRAHV